MIKQKSILEQIMEKDPRLAKLFEQTFKKHQKAANDEIKSRKLEEAEMITAQDLAIIVR